MKKIMFSDAFGLTQAVLEGRKTMTRRIINLTDADKEYLDTAFDWDLRESVVIDRYAQYKVGEVVAVAQSYKEIADYLPNDPMALDTTQGFDNFSYKDYKKEAGWNNKMFTKADLMPHQIKITDIKVERLQDISNDEALKEGMRKSFSKKVSMNVYDFEKCKKQHHTPRHAFAELIEKVSGKGTWERNPWVFAYTFKLVK